TSAGVFTVAFLNTKEGVIAGGDYKNPSASGVNLAITRDGGELWKALSISPQWYFSWIAIAPGTYRVLALGSARAGYFYGDAPQRNWLHTWSQGLNAASFVGTNVALGVGSNGTIVKLSRLE